jgi:hypothetical protein
MNAKEALAASTPIDVIFTVGSLPSRTASTALFGAPAESISPQWIPTAAGASLD